MILTHEQHQRFDDYARLLHEVNQRVNVTGFKTPELIRVNLIDDAVKPLLNLTFPSGIRVLDVGSGGGVPGIPLAILHPDIQVTLLDATRKKMEAVEAVIKALGLKNVRTMVGRAETLGHEKAHREQYDVVMAKAVAALPTLLEYLVPFTKVGGKVLAYKGREYADEIDKATKAIRLFQLSAPEVHTYSVSPETGERVLLEFMKEKPTPKDYPRREGIPEHKPL